MTPPIEFLSDIKPYFADRHIVYVDIGAFRGDVYQSLKDSKINILEAHLFEPNPTSFIELENNIKDDPVASIYNLAITGSSADTLRFLRDAKPSMSKVIASSIQSRGDIIDVPATCYDSISSSFWHDGQSVALLKVDVEGHELSVFEGASAALSDQKIDVIYVEAGLDPSNKQQTYYRDVENLLNSFGYRIFKIYEQQNEWVDDNPLLRRINIAFFSQKFADSRPASSVHLTSKLKADVSRLEAELTAMSRKVISLQTQLNEAGSLERQLRATVRELHYTQDLLEQRNLLLQEYTSLLDKSDKNFKKLISLSLP